MVFEQGRDTRVKYGKGVRKMLSERLTEKFGYTDIFQFCSFYIAYSKLQTVSEISKGSEVWVKDLDFAHIETRNRMFFLLPWSHYLILMRIDNPQTRSFYEIEDHNL